MKLILAIILCNEEKWLPLVLESAKLGLDKIVFVDSESTDKTKEVAEKFCKDNNIEFVWFTYHRAWEPVDDGKQRNVYLNYLKEHHVNDWCLVLDADEVIKGNLSITKNQLSVIEKDGIDAADIRTHHLIGDFGHEDATLTEHWTQRRMFKISKELYYPETEHNVLQGCLKPARMMRGFEIWHFAHARHAFYWLDKHIEMRDKTNIHPKEFQEWWYYNHLFGKYPRTPVSPSSLPTVVKDKFLIKYDIKPMKVLISVSTVPNNTDMLCKCIETVEKYTHENHQVLITHNNWISFAYAHNKALSKALEDEEVKGVVILNDDVRIRRFDWLDKLREAAISINGKVLSIVGTKDTMRKSKVLDEEKSYLAFYCVYIPKEIIKEIGLLDERFQIGDFEDLDYCLRARKAGFGIVELKDELIDHDMSHTVGDIKDWRNDERIKNEQRFIDKWNIKDDKV